MLKTKTLPTPTMMKKDFATSRLDKFGVMPEAFLKEFNTKDASVRRYLLNSFTLFASISPEQQHQILNDLIQAEILNLAKKSQNYIQNKIIEVLKTFGIVKSMQPSEIADYYYRYYLMTGFIPEDVTADYLSKIIDFILGVEIAKMILSMSFIQQQRLFEIQGNYSNQVILFYRYIKPIRRKLIADKVIKRDKRGEHYYAIPLLTESEKLDYVFELFNMDKILYLGSSAKNFTFDKEYIYNQERGE
ncbi:MAG: hypothetical protein N3E45_15190 [Oscillatoriaceae bacterium SKW80]|nr:hypothetical protein [Oscillatoriaceae bacterium SKYG93]MCX8122143.1 hypothetical protein [Oscillatoriaceae bacterium SKW80]MDW8454430.1 hypothetical protein [Oscillatoriaceae cyanobacterium SKYGB_i_bin93]